MDETLRIDNLFARRSIRRYTDEPVSEEQIDLLLKAAMAAPLPRPEDALKDVFVEPA